MRKAKYRWLLGVAILVGFVVWCMRLPFAGGYHLRDHLKEICRGGEADLVDPHIEALRKIGPKGIPYLLSRIRKHEREEEEWTLGLVGFSLLGNSATSAVPALVELLRKTNNARPAALCLRCLGAPGIEALLTEWTNGNRCTLRAVVGAFSSERALIMEGLSNSPPAVRASLLATLDDRLLRTATNAVADDCTRAIAVGLLSESSSLDPQSDVLLRIIEDAASPHEIRRVALNSLYALNPEYADTRRVRERFGNDPDASKAIQRGIQRWEKAKHVRGNQ